MKSSEQAFREFDITIVGGGMVGASLALLLTQQQPAWKILIVEAFANPVNPSVGLAPVYTPSFDARSTALSESSREIFEQLGLWAELSLHTAQIKEVHVSDRGHVGSTRLSASEQNLISLGSVIENQWMGSVLMAALNNHSQIEMMAPAKVDTIKPIAAGMHFSLHDVSAHFSSKLMIVADGAQSETREKLGIGVKRRDYGKTAVITNLCFKSPHQGVAFERFTDEGPMALLPLPSIEGKHRCALVWTMSPDSAEQMLACDDEVFVDKLQERFGYRLGKMSDVGERFSFPLSLVEADEQVRSNLVVIGNAAHSLHPVAGQGFNLSLRDAAMLAETLAVADANQQPLGDLAVLGNYLQQQQQDQRQTIGLSDFLPKLFSIKAAPIALARNIGLLALDSMPPLRHQFARLGMGLDTRGIQSRQEIKDVPGKTNKLAGNGRA